MKRNGCFEIVFVCGIWKYDRQDVEIGGDGKIQDDTQVFGLNHHPASLETILLGVCV